MIKYSSIPLSEGSIIKEVLYKKTKHDNYVEKTLTTLRIYEVREYPYVSRISSISSLMISKRST